METIKVIRAKTRFYINKVGLEEKWGFIAPEYTFKNGELVDLEEYELEKGDIIKDNLGDSYRVINQIEKNAILVERVKHHY